MREKSVSAITLLLVSFSALCFFCASCKTDDETSEDFLSFLRADFVEVHTRAEKTLDYALSDEGDSLVFDPLVTADWATTADSIYRALLLYNKNSSDGRVTDVISVNQVMTLWMLKSSRIQEVRTDPVSVESAWMSRNGKYVNLGIYIKTGKENGSDARQSLAMVCDTVMSRDDGSKEYQLRLYHDQNGVPEYYSSRIYLSVPIGTLRRGDAIRIEANTYDGVLTRSFVVE